MASTYTTRIRLEKQEDGENANTWGLKLNQNVIDLVDEAVAGFETIDIDGLSSATLTSNDGTIDQSRNFGLRFTGTLAADCTVVAPSTEKVYFVGNDTIGGNNVVMKSGTASETVYAGSTALIAFDGTNSIKLDGFVPGTSMLFYQAAAPIGWTKQSINDKALRVVSGSGGSTGGTTAFSTIFSSKTPAGSISGGVTNSHTLTISQMPSHTHSITSNFILGTTDTTRNNTNQIADRGANAGSSFYNPTYTAASTGGGAGHTHNISAGALTFTGTPMNFAVQYADIIICTKD
jgi:hypothetical protein